VIYPVVITASARNDLDGIGEYIRDQSGPQTAEKFVRRVILRLGSLDFAPERNVLREDLALGLRAMQV
jgi:plasmid stabilization system protein ParE